MSAEDINETVMTNEELEEEEEQTDDEEQFEDEEEGMSQLSELFGDGDDEEYEDGDLFFKCETGCGELRILDVDEMREIIAPVNTSKTVTEIAQPVKITTAVGAEVDSKGQLKPNCKFTIERSITTEDDVFEIMADDFDALIERVKQTIAALRGEN